MQLEPLNGLRRSVCGDSARATAGSQALVFDRELDPQELSSLCCAARAIADEVVQAEATRRAASASSTSPARYHYPSSEHELIISMPWARAPSRAHTATGSVCSPAIGPRSSPEEGPARLRRGSEAQRTSSSTPPLYQLDISVIYQRPTDNALSPFIRHKYVISPYQAESA